MRNKNCTRLQRDEQTLIIYCFYLYPQYMYGIGVNNSAVDPPNTCNSLLKRVKIRSRYI